MHDPYRLTKVFSQPLTTERVNPRCRQTLTALSRRDSAVGVTTTVIEIATTKCRKLLAGKKLRCIACSENAKQLALALWAKDDVLHGRFFGIGGCSGDPIATGSRLLESVVMAFVFCTFAKGNKKNFVTKPIAICTGSFCFVLVS